MDVETDVEVQIRELKQGVLQLAQHLSSSQISDAERRALTLHLVHMRNILWQITTDRADLESAFNALKQVLPSTSKDSEDRLFYIASLGSLAGQWYLQCDDPETREEVLDLCKSLTPEIPSDNQMISSWYIEIMRMLRTKYKLTKEVSALEDAVRYGREALNDHVRTMVTIKEEENSAEDNEAIVEAAQDHIDLQLRERSSDLYFFLGSLLHDLFLARGKSDKLVLKEGECCCELAINSAESPAQVEAFSEQRFLSLILLYEVTSSLPYLKEAKALAQSRLDFHSTSPSRRRWLIQLAGALTEEFKHSLRDESITEAIQHYRDAFGISVPPGEEEDEETMAIHHGLADALLCRNELRSDMSNRSITEMDEALEHVNVELAAYSSDPRGNELLFSIYGLRGQIRISRYQISKDQDDLKEGISDVKETKKRMHPENMYQLEASYSLALALFLSDSKESNESGARHLIDIWHSKSAPRGLRILATIQLSRYYNGQEEWQKASEMMDNAMTILPLLHNPSQTLSDLANSARRFSSYTSEACALALQAGRKPFQAVDLLELSRASILTRLLDQKGEVEDLKRSGHLEDADNYLRLRRILSNQPDRMPLRGLQVDDKVAALRDFDASGLEMQELLSKIRSRQGFERFLLGPDEQQLCDSVSGGCVVIVNMTKLRSDAILITSSGIRSFELRLLKYDAAMAWLKKNPTQYDRANFRDKNIEFRSFLAWLWKSCVKDILSEVLAGQNDFSNPPRIWWMGLGPCAYFPFHAAGIHDGVSKDYTMASVISSYIPTLRSFLDVKSQAQTTRPSTAGPNVLLVGMKTTPGLSNLPGIVHEEASIRRFESSMSKFDSLYQQSSSRILDSLGDYEMIHFACHGISDNHESGLDSSLVLEVENEETGQIKQDKLYVQQIYNKHSKKARLAYLSACSTAYLEDARMVDENIHLVSSFMIAGFANVIGTLWVTLDHFCTKMTDHFYEQYFDPGTEFEAVPNDAALALHQAMVKLRDTHPRQPLGWAPYVHYGI